MSERIRELVLKGAENCTPEEAHEVVVATLSAVQGAINAALPPLVDKIDTSLPYCDCMKKLIGANVVIKSGIDGFYYYARFHPVTRGLNSQQITSGYCPMCEAIIPDAPHYHDRKRGEKR